MTPSSPLVALVAMTPDGTIGLDNDMPWHLSSDLQRFKQITTGGLLVMGRKTYESIGKPLPKRITVVLTRDPQWSAPGVSVANSPEHALAEIQNAERPAFVVGGAEIYRQLLPHCDELHLTTVWSNVRGDTALRIDLSEFEKIGCARLPASLRDEFPTDFVRYRRKMPEPAALS